MAALLSERCKLYFDISTDKIPMKQRVQAIQMFEKATGKKVCHIYEWYSERYRVLECIDGDNYIESYWSNTRKYLDENIKILKAQGYIPFTCSITLGEL